MADRDRSLLDVDSLMERIRAEARRRRAGDGAGESRPNLYLEAPDERARASPAPEGVRIKGRYGLGELLGHSDEAFVRNAYLAVLGRPPDVEGHRHYLGALRAGELDRVEVVGGLRFSEEGRARDVRVRGLRAVWLFRKLRKVPMAGPLVAWFNHFIRLPRLGRMQEQAELRTRQRFERLEERLNEVEHRLALLAARAERDDRLSQEASELSALAAELSELSLSRTGDPGGGGPDRE